jgi:putative transposase
MPIIPDPPLSAYEPHLRVGCCAVQLWAAADEPIFGRTETANLLRSVLRQVREDQPFQMVGFVILPSQCQFLIVPGKSGAVGQIVEQVTRRYQKDYGVLMGNPVPPVVWQPRRRMETIHSAADFAHSLDALHYAPVQARHVRHPEEWPHSSYGAWVERGLYKLGWGWEKPERLVRKGR